MLCVYTIIVSSARRVLFDKEEKLLHVKNKLYDHWQALSKYYGMSEVMLFHIFYVAVVWQGATHLHFMLYLVLISIL